jgi:hypothetical protein
MKDLPVRNIFLPATVVGASLFSMLAFQLPNFVSHYVNLHSQPDAQSAAPASVQLGHVHKELAIGYIGTTIVLSAGIGLLTAECLRRRSQSMAHKPELKQALALFVDQQAQQDTEHSEAAFTAMMAEFPEAEVAIPSGSSDVRDSSTVSVSVDGNWADEDTSQSEQPRQLSLNAYWSNLPGESTAAFDMASSATGRMELEVALGPIDTIMIFPGQYQRCRIQVPGVAEKQYAISFKQHFYRLLSSGVTKESALAVVKQLGQSDRDAIVTTMNRGYAVWVKEPSAELVSIA